MNLGVNVLKRCESLSITVTDDAHFTFLISTYLLGLAKQEKMISVFFVIIMKNLNMFLLSTSSQKKY